MYFPGIYDFFIDETYLGSVHNFHQMGNFTELGRQCRKTGYVVVGVCMLAIFEVIHVHKKIAKNV